MRIPQWYATVTKSLSVFPERKGATVVNRDEYPAFIAHLFDGVIFVEISRRQQHRRRLKRLSNTRAAQKPGRGTAFAENIYRLFEMISLVSLPLFMSGQLIDCHTMSLNGSFEHLSEGCAYQATRAAAE